MSKHSAKRAARILNERRVFHDKTFSPNRGQYTRPGSQNAHKTNGGRGR